MTEEDARAWVAQHFGNEAAARLARFTDRVVEESTQQNLVSRSTIDTMWVRHVMDSAQLMLLAPRDRCDWLDIGTGAGFPGMVVALLGVHDVTLVEPRRRRIDFLRSLSDLASDSTQLNISQTNVEACKGQFDVISARAVAPIGTIFDISRHLATRTTRYLLPRGRNATTELETAAADWHGMFHVEQSLSDPASGIVIAEQVAPR